MKKAEMIALMSLISISSRVSDTFAVLSEKYNIADGGGYGDNQLWNFYPKDGLLGCEQIFINPAKPLAELTKFEQQRLLQLFKGPEKND